MKGVYVLLIIFGVSRYSYAQAYRSDIKDGNKAFEKNVFDEAEIKYKQATDRNPDGFEGWFNLGDALYKQQRYDEALSAFQNSQRVAPNDGAKAHAFHNIGNVYTAQKNYNQAIEAYKSALRLNPTDDETRYNLAKALRELKQQQQQNNQDNKGQDDKKQDQKNQQKQDSNKQDQQQNQQQDQQQSEKDKAENEQNDPMKSSDNNDDAQKEENQNQPDQQNKSEEQDKPGEQQDAGKAIPQKMSKAEMEQLLEAIANAEKQTRAKLDKKKQAKVKAKPGVKDW